jgi:MYXO-CTERM domain-containing protein
VSESGSGEIRMVVRRRRTRRHRRNRIVRRCLAALTVVVFAAGFSTFALRYFSPSLFGGRPRPAPVVQVKVDDSTLSRVLSHSKPSRQVYPYSVVPGGVENAKELKYAAEHDPVVAAHYAGFDYARAQVVRLTLARTVYVSYRIGKRIYWTRRRITLQKGEKLLTDGKITARTRCANRVEETPQQEASLAEPTPEKFEQPIQNSAGTAMQAPPAAFQSALLSRPQMPGLGPEGPLALYDPFVGQNFVPISPPPLPLGLCAPVKKRGDKIEIEGTKGKKKNPEPCGSGGGPTETPEPGTWLLFVSGLAAIAWHARRKLALRAEGPAGA